MDELTFQHGNGVLHIECEPSGVRIYEEFGSSPGISLSLLKVRELTSFLSAVLEREEVEAIRKRWEPWTENYRQDPGDVRERNAGAAKDIEKLLKFIDTLRKEHQDE